MTELKYWLWLSLALYQSGRKITSLLEKFDTPSDIYNAGKADFRQIENINKKDIDRLCDKSLAKAEQVMEECRKKGIRIMTFNSEYYPKLLANIFDPPYVLYVKSQNRIDLNNALTVAVVGTRTMSDYGRDMAVKLGRDLASAGVTVISGMARGIDGAALSGALSAGGKTIAVLGCGVDIAYPPEHSEMMQKIAETGMVISEYPPGSAPLPNHFPSRNRIISGLSSGTVVVESSESGGSLITASQALEQGRDVFAVPGKATEAKSDGTNELIRQGAHLVTSALDIISEYQSEYVNIFEKAMQTEQIRIKTEPVCATTEKVVSKTPVSPLPAVDNNLYKELPDNEKRIIDCMSFTPTHVDTLAEKTNLSASELNSALTLLEMKGLIKQLAGRHFTLKL
ncbi:MAG: DNA-processing protein DprA [Clostridia bacterium]|nr:DNA-processing protein DprA [Clostridia bacterium]